MKAVKSLLFFCFIFLFNISVKSQNVRATVQSDSILIGKELLYTIDVDTEKEENIIFPDSTSFVPFELISESTVDTINVKNGLRFSKKYGIISFDDGDYIIPKMKIKIGDSLFLTDSKKITVNPVKVDTTKQGLYEVKASFDEISSLEVLKLTLENNYPLIIFIFFIISISIYFKSNIFRFFNPSFNIKPSLRPIELVKKRLLDLEKVNIDTTKGVKLFYSNLTFYLRSFFEKEVYNRAFESTTRELIQGLNNVSEIKSFPISKNSINRIEEVFKRADLVKFAKFLPEKNIIQNDLKITNKEIEILSKLLPEPSEEEKLKNLIYQKKVEKKLRKKRFKIFSISLVILFIILFILSGILYGFQYSFDKLTFNENLRLAEKNWVKSEYGSPGIYAETPDAMLRIKQNNEFLYDKYSLESQFYFSNSNRSIEFFISDYSSESKIDPQNFQLIMEYILDGLEMRGLQDIVTKYDKFETKDKEKGLIIFGTTDFKISDKELSSGEYKIVGFLSDSSFKIIVLLTHYDRYIDKIGDRIINSIEVLKEDKK